MEINLEAIGVSTTPPPAVMTHEAFVACTQEFEDALCESAKILKTGETIEFTINELCKMKSVVQEFGIDDSLVMLEKDTYDPITEGAFSAKDADKVVLTLESKVTDAGKAIAKFFRDLFERIAGLFVKLMPFLQELQKQLEAESKRISAMDNPVVSEKAMETKFNFVPKAAKAFKDANTDTETLGKLLDIFKSGEVKVADIKSDSAMEKIINGKSTVAELEDKEFTGKDAKVSDIVSACEAWAKIDLKGLTKVSSKLQAVKKNADKIKAEGDDRAEIQKIVSNTAAYAAGLASAVAGHMKTAKALAKVVEEKKEGK